VTTREAEIQPAAVSTRLGADGLVLFAAGVGALLCLARVGLNGEGVIAAFVAFVLVRLAAIDFRSRLLPNRIVLPATTVVLLAHLVLTPSRAPWFLLAAAGAAGAFFIPALLRPGALGMGDVKVAMLLGAALGGAVVPALMVGSFAAGVFAAGLVLVRGRGALRMQMPLGPFLAFGGLVLLLV
jgi:leader peptidase (prepilin peptidase) / N-methyltransferase